MAIVQWNDPFAGLTDMHSQLDSLFNGVLGKLRPAGGTAPINVYTEDEKQLVTELDAPGFNKDDIEVHVHDGVLEIKGEKHEKDEDKKKRNYMVRESYASFYRRIALPRHADDSAVKAELKNGVLKVTVPFKELPKPKKVAIGEGGKTGKSSKK